MSKIPTQIDPEALQHLPVDRKGFRLRGLDMTRLETFTDAAFAFSVTLLVVSVDAVPTTFDELMTALRALPVFGGSFALLMLFWYGHWQWSRRYGLEDLTSIMLSLALVFTVLSYVYPLKYMWAMLTWWLSGGQRVGAAPLDSPEQLGTLFAIYGVGFAAMSLVIAGLNAHAWRLRDELLLSAPEALDTRGEIVSWLLMAGVGCVSVAVALSGALGPAGGGWAYMLLPVVLPGWGMLHRRKRARLAPAPAV